MSLKKKEQSLKTLGSSGFKGEGVNTQTPASRLGPQAWAGGPREPKGDVCKEKVSTG